MKVTHVDAALDTDDESPAKALCERCDVSSFRRACADLARIVDTEDGAADETARLINGDLSEWTIGSVRDVLDWAADHPAEAYALSRALGGGES